MTLTCQQVDAFFDQQWGGRDAPVPRNVADHLEQCAACRNLLELLRRQGPERPVSAGVQSQIESTVLGSLEPVTLVPSTTGFVLAFLAVFALGLLVSVSITGLRGLHRMNLVQVLVVGSVLVAGGVLLAVSLSRLVVPGSRHRIQPKVLVVSVAAAFLCALALLFPWKLEARAWYWNLSCFSVGSLLALLATFPLWLLVRRGAVLWPALTGAATGLLAGLVGATVINLGCPTITAPHLITWHATVPISCTLAGFLVGKLSGHRSG